MEVKCSKLFPSDDVFYRNTSFVEILSQLKCIDAMRLHKGHICIAGNPCAVLCHFAYIAYGIFFLHCLFPILEYTLHFFLCLGRVDCVGTRQTPGTWTNKQEK